MGLLSDSPMGSVRERLKLRDVLCLLRVNSAERPGRLQLHHLWGDLSRHSDLHLDSHPRDEEQNLPGDQPALCQEEWSRDRNG